MKKLILAAALGVVAFAGTAHADMSQSEAVCKMFMRSNSETGYTGPITAESCTASDNGIDLLVSDPPIRTLTEQDARFFVDMFCHTILQNIVDGIHPRLFSVNLLLETG